MKRRFLTLLLGMVFSIPALAQDFNVEVTVDRSRINTAALNYMDAFASELEVYFNDHDWTEATADNRGPIAADIQVILTGVDSDFNFRATVVIRSMRPVGNTARQTTLFLARDDNWTFNYIPNRALRHDDLRYDSIATLLDFYGYLMLGYDFDSFYELGGSSWFAEARNMLSLAQAASSTGWNRSGSSRRNRAQLIAGLMNPAYEPLRKAIYTYHRLGLDMFAVNPAEARIRIMESLEMIREARHATANGFLFDLFFDVKYLELVSLFEGASVEMRLEAYDLLSEIDPGHLSEYEDLRIGN